VKYIFKISQLKVSLYFSPFSLILIVIEIKNSFSKVPFEKTPSLSNL
jgi:hypothetical protein